MLDASEEMEAAGVDMDGSEHYIALRLRGQPEPVVIKLADGEKSRLWKELQGAAWPVGSLVHGPIAPSIITRGIRSSPV